MDQWLCARAKPGQDQIAVDNLKRQNFTVYYPFETVERMSRGRRVDVVRPVFPSYILVRVMLTLAVWRAINTTRGIVKLLSLRADGMPSCATDQEVALLQAREKAGEFKKYMDVHRIRRNDLVRLKTGLDTTSVGLVLRTRSERIEFLMTCFGRQTCVIAPSHRLEVVGHVGRH